MIYVHFFQELWKSKGNRVIAYVCILIILLSIVSDSLAEENYMLTGCLVALGAGVGAIFLGMNMMRLLPENPCYHAQWRRLAAFLIAVGGIALYGAWSSCTSVCFNW